ncbi:phosphatase PAP2 family protein [Candidatus Saccharibacteria bacterium]|jgi:undecaprenyl-diphosphatase|nr:phosphatase PAP2 family protein [Candidatus Saccharibacteria bacterium]
MSKRNKKLRTIPFAGGVLVTLFAAYLIPVTLFVWLATRLNEAGDYFIFDQMIMYSVKAWHSPVATMFFQSITELGGPIVLTLATLAIATVYWLKSHKKAALMIFSSVFGSVAINVVLKSIFQRDRPDFWTHLVYEAGYSFPSGHAMASSALAIALIFLLWRTTVKWHAVALGVIYMVLVGASRMYLGVHYPTDIVAGWCVSLLWVSIVALTLYQYMVMKSSR